MPIAGATYGEGSPLRPTSPPAPISATPGKVALVVGVILVVGGLITALAASSSTESTSTPPPNAQTSNPPLGIGLSCAIVGGALAVWGWKRIRRSQEEHAHYAQIDDDPSPNLTLEKHIEAYPAVWITGPKGSPILVQRDPRSPDDVEWLCKQVAAREHCEAVDIGYRGTVLNPKASLRDVAPFLAGHKIRYCGYRLRDGSSRALR